MSPIGVGATLSVVTVKCTKKASKESEKTVVMVVILLLYKYSLKSITDKITNYPGRTIKQ